MPALGEATALKIAVFSDVHSNLEAYRASLLDIARRPDVGALWCLGDVVGYGADPELCLRITGALNGALPRPELDGEFADAVDALAGKLRRFVLGNHDAASFGDRIINFFNEAARAAALWTADNITPEARLFLQGAPLTAAEGDALLVHATPLRPREFHYVTSLEDARVAFGVTDARVVFYGHTHRGGVIAWRGGAPAAVGEEEFGRNDRYLVNVGSVGQPRDGDSRAGYVVYDPAAETLEFVRLEYDVDAAAVKIRKAGLPGMLADRLYDGW
jgi:diadenosine tetraphosphatase ApaH/serine/threonine PP2A family protein phosphatase